MCRERFWEVFREFLGSFEQSERIIIVGNLKVKVGETVVESTMVKSGVPLIKLHMERGLVIGNTYFTKKRINYMKYVVVHNDSSLLDSVLIETRLMGTVFWMCRFLKEPLICLITI